MCGFASILQANFTGYWLVIKVSHELFSVIVFDEPLLLVGNRDPEYLVERIIKMLTLIRESGHLKVRRENWIHDKLEG